MNSGKYTIDCFEDEFAVLLFREDESIQLNVNKGILPSTVKEGDILHISFNRDGSIHQAVLLEKETNEVREQANSLLKRLLNKNE